MHGQKNIKILCLGFLHLWKVVYVCLTFLTLSVLKLLDRFLHLMWEVSTDSYGADLTLLYQTTVTSTLLIAINRLFHACHNLLITCHTETTSKPSLM